MAGSRPFGQDRPILAGKGLNPGQLARIRQFWPEKDRILSSRPALSQSPFSFVDQKREEEEECVCVRERERERERERVFILKKKKN
jgi:hypothetical protein